MNVSFLNPVIGQLFSGAIEKIKRSPTVIKELQRLGVDWTEHPKSDFNFIYSCTLLGYAADETKLDLVIELFLRQEIRKAFDKTIYQKDDSIVICQIDKIINNDKDTNILGKTLRESKISFYQELQDFKRIFYDYTKLSQTPAETYNTQTLNEIARVVIEIQAEFNKLKQANNSKPNLKPYPDEFKATIEEKIKSFCGREFVFNAFEEFCRNNVNGYFTVIGDAGMGKSAIAAKYVSDRHLPCYFNIIAEGRNRPDQFLTSIRHQLITRYSLVDQDAEDADLSALLVKVSQKLQNDESLKNKSLIIVVDALDEVEQEPGAGNILFLPETLPERVYLFLTRRPYTPEKKRLRISVPSQELDLRKMEYEKLNAEDIKGYIRLFLDHDKDHKDNLIKWIAERDISADKFVEQVAAKSENNFMYLRYVLPAIANGDYNDLSLQQLPSGLQDYYRIHWVRMGMDKKPQKLKVTILFILVEIATAIPCKMIAEILDDQDEYDVQSVLDEWVEYLKPQVIEGDTCYSIYHASFLDFLQGQRELNNTRKLFREVNQRIVDYWEKQITDC